MRSSLLLVLVLSALPLESAARPASDHRPSSPVLHRGREATLLSTSSSVRARETAGPDTFALYGGPETLEGKFQTLVGAPDWQGWQGEDQTKDAVYWQVSEFNAANLGSHGAGNRAYWCGRTAEQAPHFASPPGYGPSWNAIIQYESDPVSDPSVGQTLNLDFLFNHDTEPGYDFLRVEVEQGGTWNLLHDQNDFDGSNRDAAGIFAAPGVRFSDVGQSVVTFNGNDYGGPDGDRIRVRIRVVSDGAMDDQNGLWPTVAGACQIDDISVSHDGFSAFEDFEGNGPYLFQPAFAPFVGDFSEVFLHLEDIDPYRRNPTPVVAFIDYGQTVRNGPAPNGATSTGGSTSTTNYGLPGGYVVNFTGGLSGTEAVKPLSNRVVSPWIQWDLPGPDDDDPTLVGAKLRFDVYADLPLENGLFYQWFLGPGSFNQPFSNDNVVYYSQNGPRWHRVEIDVTGYLHRPPYDSLRVALGVGDFSTNFGLPGGAATPAPYFDNVSLLKYRLDGPRIATVDANLMQNAFPDGTDIDASTPSARSILDVTANSNSTFASFEATFESFIEGTYMPDVRVYWALKKNPLFADSLRVVPTGYNHENVVTGPQIWTGELVNPSSWRNRRGFVFPLPGAFYPGDVLEYFFSTTDNLGNVTTLPTDTSEFGIFNGNYDRRFTVRGLPTIHDATNAQPPMLLYFGAGQTSQRELALMAMAELGRVEGTDFDVYFAPSGGTRRTLGENANALQIDRYSTILVFAGGGDDYGLTTYQQVFGADLPRDNKGLDDATLNLLDAWSASSGDRRLVVFGSHLGLSLAPGTGAAPAFLANSLGVARIDDDVRDAIGGQLAPGVRAVAGGFSYDYVVSGSPDLWCALDELVPIPPAVRAHAFTLPDGSAHSTAAASIFRVETVGNDKKVHLTFPFSLQFVRSPIERAPVGLSARARLLEDVFSVLGVAAPSGTPTSTPERVDADLRLRPNPFNPSTAIEFVVPRATNGGVAVFDLRGRRVRVLHTGPLRRGPNTFDWDGRDDRGATVASGVYVVRAHAGPVRLEKKALLLK